MKTTVAAIWYMIDQNEPSNPFLLELETTELTLDAFKEVVGATLLQELIENRKEYLQREPDAADEMEEPTVDEITITVGKQEGYGDIEAARDDECLIVGLPDDLAKSFGLRQ